MCGCFNRDRVKGPHSLIKSQKHRVIGSDLSKNFIERRGEKKTKMIFKNRVRKRETMRDDRGVTEYEIVED